MILPYCRLRDKQQGVEFVEKEFNHRYNLRLRNERGGYIGSVCTAYDMSPPTAKRQTVGMNKFVRTW